MSATEIAARPTAAMSRLGWFPDTRFHPCGHIASTRTRDAVMLLNRRTEQYHTLNEVGGRIWELLDEGPTMSALVDALSREYDAPRAQLESDVVATLEQMLAARLIALGSASQRRLVPTRTESAEAVTAPVSPSPSKRLAVPTPSVLRSTLMITWIKLLLLTVGFERTLAWIRRRVEGVPVDAETEIGAVRKAEHNVAMAAALYPGRAQCLERSLALYGLLRRRGVAVQYCQGARPYPFEAHAWVTYRGEVVNDVAEHAEMFAPLPALLP